MKDFTSQQREVVARKLGYEGPMQGFDEFLSSSPPLAMKYATITGKFAERMAKGGLVKMKRKYGAGGSVSGHTLTTDDGTEYNLGDSSKKPPGNWNWVEGGDMMPSMWQDGGNDNVVNNVNDTANTTNTNTTNTNNTNNTNTTNTGGITIPADLTTAEQKADFYNSQIAAGKTDAQIRAASGTQSDADWTYLTGLAAKRPKTTSAGGVTVSADVKSGTADQKASFYNTQLAAGKTDAEIRAASGTQTEADWQALQNIARQQREATGAVTGGGDVTFDAKGKPINADATQITAKKIDVNEAQNIDTTARAGETATTAEGAGAVTATTATTPEEVTTSTYGAAQTAGDVATLLKGVSAVTGTVGKESQVAAQTMLPTETALNNLKAAQGDAALITKGGVPPLPSDWKNFSADQKIAWFNQNNVSEQGLLAAGAAKSDIEWMKNNGLKEPVSTERTIGAEEKISSAVDTAKAEATAIATEKAAAEGKVTEEMTVQGQLNKLMTNFDAGNPPPWAAANLRSVTAVLAARGLGASSLAGQALIQATLESALPIASADAQAYQAVASQNLSNRQQTAVLAAQQRAAFLGQEFDQAFQSKVTNAAKVADIANMNFTAQQQIVLENAKAAQTMNLANMSNEQALVMAKAAQIASLETTNLTNKQQAAVVNAQAFLQMDMQNLSNQQQTVLFKTQQMTQSLLTDAASNNAAMQFNAASTNQVEQFNNTLSTQVSQFNSSQKNAIAQFNTDQANALAKFNAEAQNQRETFNATQRLVIDQSNAQWQREISTANTAATNAANNLNAQLSQNMTLAEYNNETQLYRDSVTYAWQQGQNDLDRANKLAISQEQAYATLNAGSKTANTTAKNDLIKTGVKAVATWLLSDENMKDVHGTITNALDKVKQLNGYSYNYKVEAEPFGYSSTVTTMGVLAGQVKKVLPDAVKPFAVGIDMVDYAAVNGLLVAAVNELVAKVDKLSTRLDAMENK